MVTSFKRPHTGTATFSAPNPEAGHHLSRPLLETPGHSQGSLGQSLVGSLLLSPGSWCKQVSVCALRESVSPVPYKFWRLHGGVNGDLLQEGLCHTQVCCTQSPCPCNRPLLTCTFTGDTQTQFWLSLCGGSGSWCTQGLFEPSERLWQVRGLIPNVISRLLPSCWGFSFTLGHGVSFFDGIQHSPADSCSAVSCSFGVPSGEDERTSFCSVMLHGTHGLYSPWNSPGQNTEVGGLSLLPGICPKYQSSQTQMF